MKRLLFGFVVLMFLLVTPLSAEKVSLSEACHYDEDGFYCGCIWTDMDGFRTWSWADSIPEWQCDGGLTENGYGTALYWRTEQQILFNRVLKRIKANKKPPADDWYAQILRKMGFGDR